MYQKVKAEEGQLLNGDIGSEKAGLSTLTKEYGIKEQGIILLLETKLLKDGTHNLHMCSKDVKSKMNNREKRGGKG